MLGWILGEVEHGAFLNRAFQLKKQGG